MQSLSLRTLPLAASLNVGRVGARRAPVTHKSHGLKSPLSLSSVRGEGLHIVHAKKKKGGKKGGGGDGDDDVVVESSSSKVRRPKN